MPTTEKPQFLLLFRQSPNEARPTPEEMQQLFGRWMDWVKSMKAKGQYLGGNRLYETGSVIRGKALTDGPFSETKEIVGGYILIAAENIEQAIQIAKECPGIEMGDIVEVRPIEPLPI